MKTAHAAALSMFLAIPLTALAADVVLPNSGANDEGLGKESVLKLASALPSHSATRRVFYDDLIGVAALRAGPGAGTVFIYRANSPSTRNPYQFFAIRVYLHQVSAGKVEAKVRTFCDTGPDRYLNISAANCEYITREVAPKLMANHQQDLITFIGGANTTPNAIKAAGDAIHATVAPMVGGSAAPAPAAPATGQTIQGDIDG